MKTIQNTLAFSLFLGLSIGLSSCGDDDEHQVPVSEGEVVTTLEMHLVNIADTTDIKIIAFRDLDGDGGVNGIITPDTLRLDPNAVYQSSLRVLDESRNPITDLTPEIIAEGHEHQFFYTPSQGLQLTVANLDPDQNNKPLGLKADVTTAAASRGTLRISLSHYDVTPKDGVTPSGETDIEVNFPVAIGN